MRPELPYADLLLELSGLTTAPIPLETWQRIFTAIGDAQHYRAEVTRLREGLQRVIDRYNNDQGDAEEVAGDMADIAYTTGEGLATMTGGDDGN